MQILVYTLYTLCDTAIEKEDFAEEKDKILNDQ